MNMVGMRFYVHICPCYSTIKASYRFHSIDYTNEHILRCLGCKRNLRLNLVMDPVSTRSTEITNLLTILCFS